MKYKKSPIYRTGNKHKLLKEIVPKFPENIETFYDVFGGSGVVVINANAEKKVYNELDKRTYKMMKMIKKENINLKKRIEEEIETRDCGDEEFYNKIKQKYNMFVKKEIEKGIEIKEKYFYLWILSFASFSNDLRYNEKGEMNNTYGKRFSNEKKYEVNNLENIVLKNESFEEILKYDIGEKDFIFIDPLYLQSAETNKSTYNESWDKKKEKKLLEMLNELNAKGIKFMITNTIISKGVENKMLVEFIKKNKLQTFELSYTNNANGQKNNDYKEVMIVNYKIPYEQESLF